MVLAAYSAGGRAPEARRPDRTPPGQPLEPSAQPWGSSVQPVPASPCSSPSAMSNQAPWSASDPAPSRDRIQGNVRRLTIDCSTDRNSSARRLRGGIGPVGRVELVRQVPQRGDPGADEVRRRQRRRVVERRRHAAAAPVAHDHDRADAEGEDRELEGGAGRMAPVVGRVDGHERGDVPDHEQLARAGVEHRLGPGPRVGAGDDHRARSLALVGQAPVPLALGRVAGIAEAVVAGEQVGGEGRQGACRIVATGPIRPRIGRARDRARARGQLHSRVVTIPQYRLRNFSIIAHIDHGKSTLADRLLELTHTIEGRQMMSQVLDSMDLEREKGITIKARAVRLEYLANDGLVYGLNLIDTPGHVDFSYEVSRSLQACEGAILVVDAAQGIEAQTLANVHLAIREGLTIIPVLNKIDLPSAQPDVVMEELENVLAIPREEVILASAKEGTGVPEILEAIVARIPPPKGDPGDPVRALVFDSHYDPYKGVVCYVRLAAGTLHDHDVIRLMASGAEAELLELGFFRPQQVPVGVLDGGRGGLRRHGPQERPRGAGRRHGDDGGQPGDGGAPRLPGGEEPGVRRAVPAVGPGLPAPPGRAGEAAPQRCLGHVRAGELRGAGLRVPLRVPGPAPHGDRPGAPRARVQPRPDRERAVRGVPRPADDGARLGDRGQPGQVPGRGRDRVDRGAVGQARRGDAGPVHRLDDGADDRTGAATSSTSSTWIRSGSTCTSSCRWPS